MITVLTGTNHFLLQAKLQAMVRDFVAQHGDMALDRLDGEEASLERIREAIDSLPFLASRKLVVLKTPGANRQFVEQAETILADVSDTTDVVLVEPKLDKRLVYYKFLKKKTDFQEYNELDEMGLGRWLVTVAQETGGSLTQSDARYLVERVGANQQLLSGEIDKLLSYAPKITRANIDLLTEPTPQSTIFDLVDAAMSGRVKRALELYAEQRSLKVEPQQIIAMLGWQLHVLCVVKAAGGRDPVEVAREAKLNPFVVRKTQSLARNLSLPQLKHLVHDVLQLDIKLKTQSIDADEALQNLILSLGN
jgi:DNA polymerase-3 subunit delta